MSATHLPFEDLNMDQVGVVVRDVRAVAETLGRLFGIGPFRILEWPIEGINPESTYHGQPEEYRLLLGFATIGRTQIELVQPLAGRSIWRDFLETHGPGLHHVRFTVPDFEEMVAYLEGAGVEKIASGTGAHIGSEWAYFDTGGYLDGVMVELRKRLEGPGGEGKWAGEGVQGAED